MSSNKNQPKLEVIDTEEFETNIPISVRAHIEHITKERDQYKAQVERLQAEAALAQAQYGQEAHTRIQGLEAEIQEYEKLRIMTDVTSKLSERVRQALEAKIQGLEAKLIESEELKAQSEAMVQELEAQKTETEGFKIQAHEAERLWTEAQAQIQALQNAVELEGRFKVFAQAQFQESEKLRIQAQEALEAYKAQTEGDFEEANQFLVAQRARCSDMERLLIDMRNQAQTTFVENQALQQAFTAEQTKFKELEAKYNKLAQARSSGSKPEDKLEISRLKAEITRLSRAAHSDRLKEIQALQKKLTEVQAFAESQEEQFKDLKVIHNTNLGAVKWQLKVKENEVVTLQRSLEAANWKLDTEQKKFEALQQEQRENAEHVQEMRDKNLLQVEIQLDKSREEVLQVQNQLEQSQAEVRRVLVIVKEKEDKLEEVEAKLAEAQAPKKRGRPVKEETAAKKRKLN